MTKEELAALLGRPLTPTENTNFDLYLDIAKESLEELLCITIEVNPDGSGDAEEHTQEFDIREGHSTVFTGIFTEITEVKVDGKVTTDYYPAFWDKRNNTYYNSIVFDKKLSGHNKVTLDARWGFNPIVPNDLKMLWAQLFANVSKKYKAGKGNVKRKDVRNFSITFGDLTDDEAFLNANRRTISKYSMCNIGYVLHGKTCKTHRSSSCGCV